MANTVFDILINHNKEQAAAMAAEREQIERTTCINCGKEIAAWEKTIINGNRLTMTYRCSCGCQAEQHFLLTYQGTVEVEQ